MNKYIRLFNTIKYLKVKQIYFRLFYFVRNRYRNKVYFTYPTCKDIKTNKLLLINSISSYRSYENSTFNFLNLSNKFENNIDWNYSDFGKLWTYNISYFDFLHQKNIKEEDALVLIFDFINNEANLKDALEPFPISLRGINWVKFLSYKSITDSKIDDILYKHYQILMDNIEYHLLGNHLLENGFSLLFGAYYYEDEKLYQKAREILENELNEQILEDGAHFELSPMYHQIMLFRVLDCINLISNNNFKDKELLDLLIQKASIMIGWLENITYKNGSIPLLNDSANNIAPCSNSLFDYAKRLNIKSKKVKLSDSGYRKISKETYECIVDIGNIGPDYIPGHAHSDTFNYEVQTNDKPFIVDTGLSTYETCERRTIERSTKSHNTVEINKKDQSEIWGGFRVANRAKVIDVKEKLDFIEATHDGYKKDGILHTRQWSFQDNKIIINDSLSKEAQAISRIHFHSNITKDTILKSIKSDYKIKFIEYKYSPEFNKQINAIAIEIAFVKNLKIEIQL